MTKDKKFLIKKLSIDKQRKVRKQLLMLTKILILMNGNFWRPTTITLKVFKTEKLLKMILHS